MPSEPSADRIRQENEITAGFMAVVQKRFDQLAKGLGSTPFNLDEPERQVLIRVNNSGLLKGAAAGILSLVFLRRIRSSVVNRVLTKVQQQQQGGSPPRVSNSPFQQTPAQPIPPLSTNSPLENALRRRQNPWSLPNVLGWILDASVSFFVAATASIALTDRQMVLQSISTLPLIEGKSRVAAEFCPDMVAHYLALQKDAHARNIMELPQTNYLKAIQAFCFNCQRRKRQETMLRETMGMDASAVVSIPPPGVTVSDDDSDLWNDSGNEGSLRDNDGDSLYGSSQEDALTQWTEDFVLDQGEEDHRENK
jgi:hypothetical protein